jgi:hypothetical protein
MRASQPEPGYRPLTNEVAEIEPEIVNALTRIVGLDGGQGKDGEFAPRAISLSPEATETFEQFLQFMHDRKRSLDGREREWWCKTRSKFKPSLQMMLSKLVMLRHRASSTNLGDVIPDDCLAGMLQRMLTRARDVHIGSKCHKKNPKITYALGGYSVCCLTQGF